MNQATVGVICTIAGIVISAIFSYLAFFRNSKRDAKQGGEDKGVMMSDIGYIKAGVDDLKREQRDQASNIGQLSERVTRCEESCKQAHHRIDELKGEKE